MNADDLVKVTEDGEGQENECPVCGAEPGQPCSGPDPDEPDGQLGVEYGRYVHRARQFCQHAEIERLTAERDALRADLAIVERWACHHGTKHSAEEVLSVIQHYPPIRRITLSYVDGVVPTTPDPFAEADALRAELAALRAQEPLYRVKVRGLWHDTTPTVAAFNLGDGEHNLYAAPAPQAVEVTDEQIRQCIPDDLSPRHRRHAIAAVRAVLALRNRSKA